MRNQAPTTTRMLIVCLCAQWCGTCRDYQPIFDALAAREPALDWRWIDIEDEADLVGDIDIETFPTLLMVQDGTLLFAGPVLPKAAEVQRLIQSVREDPQRHALIAQEHLAPDQFEAYAALIRRLPTSA